MRVEEWKPINAFTPQNEAIILDTIYDVCVGMLTKHGWIIAAPVIQPAEKAFEDIYIDAEDVYRWRHMPTAPRKKSTVRATISKMETV